MRRIKHGKGIRIFLILIFFGCTLPSSLPSQTSETKWLQGYQRSLQGGTIDYHSPQPDVTKALLVRSLHAEDFIEWETDPIPYGYRGEFVNFIWIFGMDVDANPHGYDLLIDGKKYFRFANPETSSCREWTIKGPNGEELRFRVSFIDRHGDVFGYASLRMPTASLKVGKPLILRVAGETAGSRVWYMTFQSPVKEGIEIVPQQALIRRGQNLFQPVDVRIIHLGEPVDVELFAQGQTPITQKLDYGFNRIEMTFPEVLHKTEQTLSIRLSGREPIVKNFWLNPVRKWFVYLVQHTHTDIGYTRPQSEILPEHLRFIDYALDFCDLTDDYPDDARFRWTCEASWAVDQYLESRPPDQIERLKQRIREGRIELTGMPFNMSEIADENIYVAALRPIKKFKDFGLPLKTAMQNDVNGIAWCLADYFPDTGVEYLIMGQHGHRARIPFDKPTAFWWESPSGKKLLAFRADHYMTGNFWGIHTRQFESLERELARYLKDLESREYPHDRIAVQYSGYYTDNAPPSTAGCEMIKRWNEKYAWPKLRSAIASEFPEYIKIKMGEKLPVYRAAWPDWWSDGFGSAALETAAARKTQNQLTANQGLLSMAKILGMTIPSSTMKKMHKIYDALLFWDEHTMGAAESIREPLVTNSVVQWAEKSAYVWEAAKDIRLLQYSLIKKDITDPEAVYIAFPFDLPQAEIFYEAHGGLVAPGKNQLEGTSSDWHTVQHFLTLRSPKGQIIMGSDEAPLVQFGDLNLGKFQYIAQVKKPHVFSWVMNNYWVTNFRASQEGEFKWSYFLSSGIDSSSTTATRMGWSSSIPLLGRVFPSGKASDKPQEKSFLHIDADNILLVSTKPSADGKGIILHLRETEGRPAEFSLSIPSIPSDRMTVKEVNVLEEVIENIPQRIKLQAWQSKFFKIEVD